MLKMNEGYVIPESDVVITAELVDISPRWRDRVSEKSQFVDAQHATDSLQVRFS